MAIRMSCAVLATLNFSLSFFRYHLMVGSAKPISTAISGLVFPSAIIWIILCSFLEILISFSSSVTTIILFLFYKVRKP